METIISIKIKTLTKAAARSNSNDCLTAAMLSIPHYYYFLKLNGRQTAVRVENVPLLSENTKSRK